MERLRLPGLDVAMHFGGHSVTSPKETHWVSQNPKLPLQSRGGGSVDSLNCKLTTSNHQILVRSQASPPCNMCQGHLRSLPWQAFVTHYVVYFGQSCNGSANVTEAGPSGFVCPVFPSAARSESAVLYNSSFVKDCSQCGLIYSRKRAGRSKCVFLFTL